MKVVIGDIVYHDVKRVDVFYINETYDDFRSKIHDEVVLNKDLCKSIAIEYEDKNKSI